MTGSFLSAMRVLYSSGSSIKLGKGEILRKLVGSPKLLCLGSAGYLLFVNSQGLVCSLQSLLEYMPNPLHSNHLGDLVLLEMQILWLIIMCSSSSIPVRMLIAFPLPDGKQDDSFYKLLFIKGCKERRCALESH